MMKVPTSARRVPLVSGIAILLLAGSDVVARQQQSASATWITAWGSSQQALGTTAITNATVRMIARVAIGGEAVRVRLDNAFGTSPVVIGSAYIGQRTQSAALASGSNRQLLFNGSARVSIPAGGTVVSDAASMTVLPQQDLAISLYVPGQGVRPSQHAAAFVTSYASANGSGDVSADETRTPFSGSTTSLLWLKSIDVLSSSSTGSIVAFGDSITDGTCSTVDTHNRWEDWLSVRLKLDAQERGRPQMFRAMVNEGIGGNTVTREQLQPPPDSPPGIERLERDVLSHHGVTHVILFMGTNDIRRGASLAQVTGGIEDIIGRVKARGLKIVGVTIIPRHNAAASGTNTGWDASKTGIRRTINQWIRTRARFDAVLDFDSVVRDSLNWDLISPPFNCDGIHPTPRGYYEMGKSVPLDLFRGGPGPTSRR